MNASIRSSPDGEKCEEILARLSRRSEDIRAALEISREDVERMHRLWESIPVEERHSIISLAVEKLFSDPQVAEKLREAGATRDFLERHLYEVTDRVCRGEPGGELGTVTLFGAINAILAGIDLGVLLGAVSMIGSKIAARARDVDTALSVSKVYLWCTAMLTENYTSIHEAVVARASGISGQVMRNLIRAYSSDLKKRIEGFISRQGRA